MDNISDSMYINENENENEEDEYDENETEHDYTNPSICQNDQLTEIKKKSAREIVRFFVFVLKIRRESHT